MIYFKNKSFFLKKKTSYGKLPIGESIVETIIPPHLFYLFGGRGGGRGGRYEIGRSGIHFKQKE